MLACAAKAGFGASSSALSLEGLLVVEVVLKPPNTLPAGAAAGVGEKKFGALEPPKRFF